MIGGRAFWTDPTARYRTLTLEPVCPPTACTALYLEDRPGDSALFVLNAVDRPEGDLGNFYYTGGGTFQGAVTAIAVTGPNVSAQGTYVDTGGNPGTWTLTWDLDDDTYVLRGFTAANVLSFEVIVTLPSAGFSIVVPDRCTLLDVSG